jgi:predicted NUDIX family phosphoesterase
MSRLAPLGAGLRTPVPFDVTAMEFVFVVPRDALFPDFYPHGFVPFEATSSAVGPESQANGTAISSAEFESTVLRAGFFVERARAECNPDWKQVIPYSIVECDGRVLLLRRLSKGGEARLHDKHSIGVGGHINPQDLDASPGHSSSRTDPIGAGTRREVEEELTVRGKYDVQRIGILNDDSNPVGAVHVGVVQVITVQGSVEIREKEQLEARLVTTDELKAMLAQGANFETWSSLLIRRLDEILPKPTAVAS